MLRFRERAFPMILVTAIVTVAACCGSSSMAEEVTVYKIQNRWNQFIGDAGAKVSYAKGGDGAKYRWVLEESPDGQRIKNHATGAYLAAAKDAPEAKLIPRADTDSLDKASLWTMDVVSGTWLSIKNAAAGKYLTCEAQRGVVDCDGTDVPTSQTWWLSQWEFVHVGGPKPPKRYRLQEIAVSSPEYCSDVAGDTTVTLVAPGFKRLTVKCWQQGDSLGSDFIVATVELDAKGSGSFVFPADACPHGPSRCESVVRTTLPKTIATCNCTTRAAPAGTKGCPMIRQQRRAWSWSSTMTSTDLSPPPARIRRPAITTTSRQVVSRTSARYDSPVLINPTIPSTKSIHLSPCLEPRRGRQGPGEEGV